MLGQNEIETLTFLLENAETEEEKIEIENQLVELIVAMEIKEEIEGGWKKWRVLKNCFYPMRIYWN